MTTHQASHTHFNSKPFRGFLTKLIGEAFYTEEMIPVPITDPENMAVYDYEDPCDQQQFLRSFIGRTI
jgi:hypothetical protein